MRTLKYLLPIICSVSIVFEGKINAQTKLPNNPHYDNKAYHFGFLIGINEMDFTLKRKQNFIVNINEENVLDVYSIDAIPEKGFNVGIVSNLRLGKHFDFRFVPDLAFGDRNILYRYIDKNGILQSVNKKIESTYVEFPFLFKYKGVRLMNARPYLIGGPKYTIDLASQANKKKKDENFDEDIVKLNRNDVAMEVGVGFDFYLQYFKFATELKMSYGLTNALKNEPSFYSNSIERLNSRIFMISFLFE